jgi:large subunit ribosomal protein L15
MRIHELTSNPRKKAHRLGRGISQGQGKTAGRGTKGQKSRTGANSNIPRTFEGAASGMIARLPKLKGFKSHREKPITINVAKLAEIFEDGALVSIASLAEHGMLSSKAVRVGVKIVSSSGTIAKKFSFDTSDDLLKVSKTLQA